MGASKIPFYVYVDESGNTGKNIFDLAQPDYYAGALISKGEFDTVHGQAIRRLAMRFGANAIHANELGLGRLEALAKELFKILYEADVKFFVSRVEKKYLLATKMFDVLFDSGENAAVAWHNYNIRPMRVILAMKLGYCVDQDIAREFWQLLLMSREQEARAKLPPLCEKLKARLTLLPDQRSREVLGGGLDWVIKHPECVQATSEQQIAKKGHFPNLVAFSNLIDGLHHLSQRYKKKVACITHDEQNEFARALRTSHEYFSKAPPVTFWWAGETHTLQRLPDSRFEMKRDEDSVGIQMADVALWLFGQWLKGKNIPPNCGQLLELVLARGWHSDFSFVGVEQRMTQEFGEVLFGPMDDEKLAAAHRMLAMAEERRRVSMEQFEADGLPPFQRPVTVTEEPSG